MNEGNPTLYKGVSHDAVVHPLKLEKKADKLCCMVNPVHMCTHCGWILCDACGEDIPYFEALFKKGEILYPSRSAFDDLDNSIAARRHTWSWVK